MKFVSLDSTTILLRKRRDENLFHFDRYRKKFPSDNGNKSTIVLSLIEIEMLFKFIVRVFFYNSNENGIEAKENWIKLKFKNVLIKQLFITFAKDLKKKLLWLVLSSARYILKFFKVLCCVHRLKLELVSFYWTLNTLEREQKRKKWQQINIGNGK